MPRLAPSVRVHSRLCHVPNVRARQSIKHSCYTDLNKLKLREPGVLFADDTKCLHSEKLPLLQADLNSISHYINDLSLVTQFSDLILFADDAKLCKTIVHSCDYLHLQDDLDQLCTWSHNSDLLCQY